VLECRQRTIFADSLTAGLSAKVTASGAVGTSMFFPDKISLPTVRQSANKHFANSSFSPTAIYSKAVGKDLFTDSVL
jgi:hypothetical protein